MISFFKTPFSYYIFLWIAYLLQGLLYQEGSLLSQVLGLLILMISLKHFVVLLKKPQKPAILRGLIIMLALYTVYGLFLFISDGLSVNIYGVELSTINYVKGYYLSILPIFSGYYYTKEGKTDLNLLKKWVPIFVIVGILVYYREETERVAKLLEEGIFSEDITNNAGYFLLGIVPCSLVFYKKPIVQYAIMLICVVLVLMSMKRGAILVASVVLFYLIWKEFNIGSARKKMIILFFALISCGFVLYYIQDYLLNNDYFVERLDSTLEGKSSGRDSLYSFFWSHIVNDMSFISLFAGEGAMATVKIAGKYAHNDWLEIMICHGFVGIAAFVNYWRSFLLSAKDKKICSISKIVLSSYFIMYLLMTFFSMSIGGMCIFSDIMIGFSAANGFGMDIKKSHL